MPKINRIRLRNIGHYRAYMNDLVLDFHGGENTIIFAGNAHGKTSIISLILTLLRPSSWDFISGKKGENRKLKHYVNSQFPSHIIIEWIYETKKDNYEFLITGLILTKDNKNNLRRTFYSIRYPYQTNSQYITFDNLKLGDKKSEYSCEKIVSLLNTQRQKLPTQKIRIIRDNIGEWQDHLDSNLIDTKLAEYQVKMNKGEGEQDQFLDFGTDQEFIRFVVKILQKFPDEDSLQAIKSSYQDFRNIPYWKAQKELIQTVIEQLKNGVELESYFYKYQQEFHELVKKWVFLQLLCQTEEHKLKTSQDNLDITISETENKLNTLQTQLEKIDISLPFLLACRLQIRINNHKDSISKLQKELNELKKINQILEILPKFRELNLKKQDMISLKKQLEEETRPIEYELNQIRQIIVYLLGKEISQSTQDLEKLQKYNSKFQEKKKNKEILHAKLQAREEIIKSQLKELNNELDEIKQKETQIAPILQQYNNNLDIGIESLTKNQTELSDKIEHYTEINKQTNINIKELRKKIPEIDRKIEPHKLDIQQIKSKFKERQKNWDKIVGNTLFKIIIEDGWEKKNVNYSVIGESNKQVLIDKELINRNKWIQATHHERELENKINTFIETNTFPYDSELEKIVDLLNSQKLNSWIGWEYLKHNISDPKTRDKIARELGFLLDGILIIDKDLNRAKNRIKVLLDTNQFQTITRTFPISLTTKIKEPFKQPPEDVFYLNPGLEWRYNEQQANEMFQKIQIEFNKQKESVVELHTTQQAMIELLTQWNNFVTDFPIDKYHQLNEQLQSYQNNLEELISLKEQVEKEIDDYEKTISSNIDLISDLTTKKDEISKQLVELKLFQKDYSRKARIIPKIQDYNVEFKDKTQQINEIGLLLPELIEKEKQLTNDIDEKRWHLNDIKKELDQLTEIGTSILKVEPESKIEPKAKEKLLEEWKNQFTNLKQQLDHFYSEHEIQLAINRLDEDISSRSQTLERYYRKFSLDESELREFSKQYESLEDEHAIYEEKEQTTEKIKQNTLTITTQKEQLKGWYKDLAEYHPKFITEEDSLKSEYKNILKSEEDLSTIINNLQTKKDDFNQLKIETEKNLGDLKEQLLNSQLDIEKINNYITIIENTLQNFSDTEIKTVPLDQVEMSPSSEEYTMVDISNLITNHREKTVTYQTNKNKLDRDINQYIQEFRNLELGVTVEQIKEKRLLEFIKQFNIPEIENISSHLKKFEIRLVSVQDKLSLPQEHFENTIQIFTTIINGILTTLKELQKIKLKIKELSYLDSKPIVKIQIRDTGDISGIRGSVENYFTTLFFQHEEFPKNLTIQDISLSILDDYLKGRIRPIKYLFPEEIPQPIYKPIEEILAGSGGEKITVGILFYCLIAYFRLQNVTTETRKKFRHVFSSPLIMDNPFGTISRLDLIKLQVGLAKNLNIQLIPFTHLKEIETFHHYANMISLKKRKTTSLQIVELDDDEDLNQYNLSSKSITVRPQVQAESTKLSSFLGEQ